MINNLKDCQKTTLIGQLPDIINNNNQAINAEFDWIFDTSLNRLKRSLYAPTGSVKAHFGEFTNLSCEYLTVKNADSLFSTVYTDLEKLIRESIQPYSYDTSVLDPSLQIVCNHELLTNRFANSDFENSNYAHDAGAIIYQIDSSFITVKEMLDSLDASQFSANIEELRNRINVVDNSINGINNSINALFDNSNISNSSINELEDDVNILYSDINNVSSNVSSINDSISEINSSLNETYNEISDIRGDINNIKTQINSSIQNIEEHIDSSISSINEEFINIDSSLNEIVEHINSSVNEINSNIINLDSSIQNINESVENLNSSLNNFISSQEEHNETVDNQIAEINTQIQVLNGGKSRVNLNNSLIDYIIAPNVYYAFNEIPLQYNNINISKMANAENPSILNEYTIRIPGNTNQVINFNENDWIDLTWENGIEPTFTKGHEYEIRIVDDFASFKDYQKKMYDLEYHLNGGSGSGAGAPQNASYLAGEQVTLHNGSTGIIPPLVTDQMNIYKKFVNWQISESETKNGGEIISMPGRNLDVSANWRDPSLYTIIYDLNGGSGSAPDDQGYEGYVIELDDAEHVVPPYDTEFNAWIWNETLYSAGGDFEVPSQSDPVIEFTADYSLHPIEEGTNLLFDNIDTFEVREINSYEELTQDAFENKRSKYINLEDNKDRLYLNKHVVTDNNDNTYYLLHTISNIPMIFIPFYDESAGHTINVSIGNDINDSTNDVSILYGNTADDNLGTQPNDQYNCDTSIIYSHVSDPLDPLSNIADTNRIDVYWTNNYVFALDELGDAIEFKGYIIAIDTDKPFNIKINYDDSYTKYIYMEPAHYAHITSLIFEMGSDQYENPHKIVDDSGTYYPNVGLTDIRMYQYKYATSEVLNTNIKLELEQRSLPHDNIITEDNDLAIHMNYTLTGVPEIDEVIVENVSSYYTGEIDEELEILAYVRDFVENNRFENYYIEDQSYYKEHYLSEDRIYYILHNLISPKYTDGNSEIVQNYSNIFNETVNGNITGNIQYYRKDGEQKGIFEHNGYFDDPILFTINPIVEGFQMINPCHLFMRMSYQKLPETIENYSLNIYYSDNNNAEPLASEIIHNPGVNFDINDYYKIENE